jgi:hypothetical protein
METSFPGVSGDAREAWRPAQLPRTPRAFRCRCGRPVFFRNSVCLACGAPLGYVPERLALLPLEPEGGVWKVSGEPQDGPRYRNCANLERAGCNWLLAIGDPAPLCLACRLNRTIPDLTIEENRAAWRSIEGAKRRLVSQLLALGLPVASRVPGAGGEDPGRGLAFDFVRSVPGHQVLTGHGDGVITVNIAEADDAVRESNRAALREPYRTLLGHLRHEIGHYYWDRLVAGGTWHAPFRALFGDERADYAGALQRNREQGPPSDWAQRCVSAYASTHPWEDWAETWAHYLHMMDTLDTALSFGFHARHLEVDIEPFAPEVLTQDDPDFLYFLNTWIELTAVMNEMSRSMGQPFFYPFVLSAPAVRKLHFVHRVVTGAAPPA